MNVAFWNINLGRGSYGGKIDTYQNWVRSMRPDFLFLEEVSSTLLDQNMVLLDWTVQAGGAPYHLLNYANTLDVNLDGSTKCLAVLCTTPMLHLYNPQARAIRVPDGFQTRLALKVTSQHQDWNGLALWGIHANASPTGGRNAVEAFGSEINAAPGTFAGGDFNCPIGTAAGILAMYNATPVQPIAWNNTLLTFTQWRSSEGTTPVNTYNGNARAIARTITPFAVIDYLCISNQAIPHVGALPNCANGTQWSDILALFDHCPVYYQLA